MDEFLITQNLIRKHIPRDSSCLFRATSETVFHCQAYHLDIRRDCVRYLTDNKTLFQRFVDGDYEEYLNNVSNPKVWAGVVEMNAMSLMYRIDFLVFQEVGMPPSQFTTNNFEKTILLCYCQGNHYDLVYRKDQLDSMAYCQALVYGLLYKDVFKLGNDVEYAVQKMLYDKSYSKKKKSLSMPYFRSMEDRREKCRIKEIDDENPDGKGNSEIREMLAQGCPPFPYKVAKALDVGIYRNVEFDRWNQARRDQERAEQLVIPDFAPGVKCLVRLMENQLFHAHIQEMSPDQGPVTVFIEELGEKKIIPFEHLQPLAIPVYKALAMQGFSCKKSIRFLDGCLKNSPLLSLSTIVSEGLRNSKRYLKKKAKVLSKELSFLAVTEKQQAICWPNNYSNQNTQSTGTAKKIPPRYLTEKTKSCSASGVEEKTLNNGNSTETCSEKGPYQSSTHNHPGKPQVSSYIPPQVQQGTQLQGVSQSNASVSMASSFQSLVPGNPMTVPFVPYTFLGPMSSNGSSLPSTTSSEFAFDNGLFNTGVTIDAFGTPFFYTFGTCDVPYLVPPMDRSFRPALNNGVVGQTGAIEAAQNRSTSGTIPSPPPQSGSYWTYNGSFTYLSSPVPGSGLGTDACEWALTDESALGFHQVPAGMPLLFFVSPQAPNAMNPGVMAPQGSFLPTVSSV